MKSLLLFFILLLPLTLASSIAVYPLEINLDNQNEFTIFNPNNHKINFKIISKQIKTNTNKGTIEPHNKETIKITNKANEQIIIETSSNKNTINPGVAIKVYSNTENQVASSTKTKFNYTLLFGVGIIIFLLIVLWRI